MKVDITTKGIDIGDAFRSYITEHVAGVIGKYLPRAMDTAVSVSKDGHVVTVDISAHVGRGLKLRGHMDNMDPYAAFDAALHKVETQVKRYKNRLTEHHSKHDTENETKALQYILSHDYGAHAEEEAGAPPVIAEMPHQIPELTVRDAVMHLDLSDGPALVFRNATHGGINVVHRRHDGTIGWVDPEVVQDVRKIG